MDDFWTDSEAIFRTLLKNHDTRVAALFGHDLPEHREFSRLPWRNFRLIVVASRGPLAAIRVYVVVGPGWATAGDAAWTTYQLVHAMHAEPMRPVTPRWASERGGDAFLAETLRSGVAPVHVKARSWRDFLRAGRTADDTMLPSGSIMKAPSP